MNPDLVVRDRNGKIYSEWRLFREEERSSGVGDIKRVLAFLFRKVCWEITILRLDPALLHRLLHYLA